MTIPRSEDAAPGRPCPTCGLSVPADPRWPVWCECGWNLDPEGEADRRRRPWERLYDRLGARQGAALFESVRASGATKPGFDLASLLLGALSLALLLLAVAVPVGAVAFVAWAWPNLLALAGATLVLAVGWLARPRLPRLAGETLASPTTHPALHRLVADVAREVGVAPPGIVALLEHQDAWSGRVGLRQRKVVAMGLPFLATEPPEVWAAVLAHELGHFANGDPWRRLPVGLAWGSLAGWCAVLTPEHPDEVALEGFAGRVALHALWVIGVLPRLLLGLMVHLAWRASQRAEYYADRVGASVSGTAAFVRALSFIADASRVERACHAVVVAGADGSVYEAMRRLEAEVPDRELTRRRLSLERVVPSLDATHPPTAYRIRLLEERPVPVPRCSLRSDQAAAILREIEPDLRRGDAALRNEFRRRLEA